MGMTTYRLTRRGVTVVMLATVAWLVACGIIAGQSGSDQLTRDYPPCVTEDSPGPCYWDAPTRGNGIGQSFIVTPDQTVIYR